MILGTMSDDQEWQPRVDKSFNTFSEGRFAFKGNQSSSGQMLVPALEIPCFHTDWTGGREQSDSQSSTSRIYCHKSSPSQGKVPPIQKFAQRFLAEKN